MIIRGLVKIQSQIKVIGRYLLLAVIFLAVISLFRNASEFLSSSHRVEEARLELEDLKLEQVELKRQESYVLSEEFKEKQIRDKLGMSREGEVTVVLPDDQTLKKLSPRKLEEASLELPDPVWVRWVKTFFEI